MFRILFFLFLPMLLFAQQNVFESDILTVQSANTNIFFDINEADLDLKEVEENRNQLTVRIRVRGITEEDILELIEEKRYQLAFENSYFSMPNWEATADFDEYITLQLVYSPLYKWEKDLGCLAWKDLSLIARSAIEFNCKYIVEFEKVLPPPSSSVPLPKD